MKILIISYDYKPMLGGVANCAFELAKALSNLENIKIKLLAPSMNGDKEFDQHNHFSTKRTNLKKTALTSILPLKKAINLEIKFFKPDIILDLLWMPDGMATMLAQKNSIPYFQMAHAVEVVETFSSIKKIIRSLLSPIKSKVFKNAKKTFTVSNFTSELVKQFCKLPKKQITVINNGINPDQYYPKEKKTNLIKKYNLQNKICFLTIGRIKKFKGMDMAIKAMKNLTHKNIPFKYLIGGIGPDLDYLRQLIIDNDMNDYVELIGKINSADIIDYYNLADVFITLSREDFKTPNIEGFGLVFLEAAACKVPSLAGNSGGIPDAVIHNETGWLVNPADITEITQTLEIILNNPDIVTNLGDKAYHRAIHEMTWNHMAKRMLSEFQNI